MREASKERVGRGLLPRTAGTPGRSHIRTCDLEHAAHSARDRAAGPQTLLASAADLAGGGKGSSAAARASAPAPARLQCLWQAQFIVTHPFQQAC